MKITIKYTLHSDEPIPEAALDLHQHEHTITDIRAFMFNIYAEEAAPPAPQTEPYIVITDFVNVRKTPSTTGSLAIGRLYRDTIIYVEEVVVEGANTWAKHAYFGETAYSAIYHSGVEYLRKV